MNKSKNFDMMLHYDVKDDESGVKIARKAATIHTTKFMGPAERKKINSKALHKLLMSSHLGGQHMALDRMSELYSEDPTMSVEELIGEMQKHVAIVNNAFWRMGGSKVTDRYSIERVMDEQGTRVKKE